MLVLTEIGQLHLMSKPSNVNNSVNLDICLGESYAGLKTTNSEKYNYSNYELDEKLSSRSLGDFLDKILFDKKIYNYDINNVTIHFDNDLYCLVPNELFDESKKKEYLKYITKLNKDDYISHDSINEINVKNIFLPYVNVNNLLIEKFSEINFYHYNTSLLKKLFKINNKIEQKNKLYCVVSHKKFKIIVFNENKLYFFNSFEYSNSSDILYFLLATCQNLKIDIEKVTLNYILNSKVNNLIDQSNDFYSRIEILHDSGINKQDFIYS
jgi:hypothetical protein